MNTPVSFEIAKLLKEKGFDEECYSYYVPEVHQKVCYQEYGGEKFDMNKVYTAFGKECFSAPTIAEIVMWLYEKHGIWVSVSMENNEEDKVSFYFSLLQNDDNEVTFKVRQSNSNLPTEVYEAAILYTLKNLI